MSDDAPAPEFCDNSLENLMVVLRESEGANKLDEGLKPSGKGHGTLADGTKFEIEPAWYDFIGDMHIRFVFDRPNCLMGATPADMARFDLSPEAALERAVTNIKRVYGAPAATHWDNRLMKVAGNCPDLDSSYFLDRGFWANLLHDYPDGVVAAVPKRGGLLYVPLSDHEEVEKLRQRIGYIYSTSENMRISSGLYLFKDDRWTVFQYPIKAKPAD